MRLAVLLLLASPLCCAADGAVDRGAQLYRKNCAVPYCHGPEGAVGRAPKIAGHSFSLNAMFKIVSWGIPGTGMPEFTSRLKTPEIEDLVAYLMTLRGAPTAAAPTVAAPPRPLSAGAKAGRALFFDSGRIQSCGSCHELDGWGTAAAPEIAMIPADLAAIPTHRVVTAKPAGGAKPFPALVVEKSEIRVRVYDLSAALPVLRTFIPSRVVLEPGSAWRHEQAVGAYSRAELGIIAEYLRGRPAPR